jgi:hypothetical protein
VIAKLSNSPRARNVNLHVRPFVVVAVPRCGWPGVAGRVVRPVFPFLLRESQRRE